MGALSALVCSSYVPRLRSPVPCCMSPCERKLAAGAVLLYALAMGMGLPLLLLGSVGNRWLPRRGLWMVRACQLFGFS